MTEVRYDYFALTDNEISSDHLFSKNIYPNANNSELGYYNKKHLIMNTRKEFTEFVARSYNSGDNDFVVKLPSKNPEEGIQEKVMKAITEYFQNINTAQIIRVSANSK